MQSEFPSEPQFRFGIRALLVAVAVCAVLALLFSWLPNTITSSELQAVNIGMTKDEVRAVLGEPTSIWRLESAPDGAEEAWYYAQWDYLNAPPAMRFRDGQVIHVRGN